MTDEKTRAEHDEPVAGEAASCPSCGAAQLGTRFCETCGHQLQQDAPSVSVSAATDLPMSSASPDAVPGDPALGLRGAALVSYLIGLVVTSSLFLAGSYAGVPWSDTIFSWLVALFLAIAAGVGRAGPGGKAVGVLFAIAYAIAIPVFDFAPMSDGYRVEQIVGPVLLFGAWAGGRGFRAGWAAVVGVVILGFLGWNVAPVLSPNATTLEVMRDGFFALSLAIVVLLANGFDGPKPGARRVNGAARASMVLLLLTFVLNSLAGGVAGGIAIFMLVVVLVLLVLAIILGHVGFVRAGRRGERGRPLAAWTLVLGYLVIVLEIALIAYVASVIAAFSSLAY